MNDFKAIFVLVTAICNFLIVNIAYTKSDVIKPSKGLIKCGEVKDRTYSGFFDNILDYVNQADKQSASSKLFCNNPIKAICHNNSYKDKNLCTGSDCNKNYLSKVEYENVLKIAKEQYGFSSLKQMRKEFHPTSEAYEGLKNLVLLTEISNPKSKQNKKFYKNIRYTLHEVKNNLINSIRSKSFISNSKKIKMIRKIEKVKFLSFEDIYKNEDAAERYLNLCGGHGFYGSSNASMNGSYNTLIICPRNALEFKNSGTGSAWQLRDQLSSLLGHEFGHLFDLGDDDDIRNTLYRGACGVMISCDPKISLNYGYMNKCIENVYKDELWSSSKGYFGEIRSDYWSNEVLSQTLKRYKNKSDKRKLNLLKRSFASYCNAAVRRGFFGDEGYHYGGEGEHPSHRFRIDMMRRHPEISKLMGCKDNHYNGKQYCGMMGEQ